MFRDTTYNDLSQTETMADASTEFVMDEEAFRGFYERNARGLWAYLARVTGDREQADDLLQETFYRFLRAASTYESESHRRNSLYRIATNLAHDARRRSQTRAPVISTGDEIENISTVDQAGATERSADLRRALSSLKPRERAMLWLAYAEGASHDEIASALGVRASSLKAMLFRARHKMAALLGRQPDGRKS
ncbi:MAG: RNA polymerase sigma factor [Bryobacteraceae bacterium]|nr:RNA polymerase sigma factor [Bryobacteraceae bacterium]